MPDESISHPPEESIGRPEPPGAEEVLTRGGWTRIAEGKPGDPVAGFQKPGKGFVGHGNPAGGWWKRFRKDGDSK